MFERSTQLRRRARMLCGAIFIVALSGLGSSPRAVCQDALHHDSADRATLNQSVEIDPNAVEAATQILEPRTINDGESARSSENRSTLQEFGNPGLTTPPTRTTPSADAIVVFRTIADVSTVAADASVNLVA